MLESKSRERAQKLFGEVVLETDFCEGVVVPAIVLSK